MIYLIDEVITNVGQTLGARPPELGGALLGLEGRPVITRFLLDEEAATTHTSYAPSRALNRRVREIEQTEGLEFKGIIHSHPPGFDRPSSQDERQFAEGLRLNPHMPFYMAPIVTHRQTGAPGDHEVGLPGAILSFYVGCRGTSNRAAVRPARFAVLPIQRDLRRVADELGGESGPDMGIVAWDRRDLLARRLLLDGGIELLLLFSEQYPILPPLILLTLPGCDTEQLRLSWSIHTPEEQRLLQALTEHVRPPGPYRRVFGPSDIGAITDDEARAARAGWPVRLSGEDVQGHARQLQDGLFARSRGLLSEAIRNKQVLVAGVGSVGSYVSDQLVRAGVGRITIIDPDTIEPANLGRTNYTVSDIGRPKVGALERLLLNANPSVNVLTFQQDLVEMARQRPGEFDNQICGADLIVAATDDPGAQRLLNHFSYARRRPALFIGLYAGAQGGEVVLSVPEQTACYVCATISRHQMEEQTGSVSQRMDYGTGRLAGEIALAADIHHVTSAAVKLALSLLVQDHQELSLSNFWRSAVEQGLSYLTMSTVSEYWFYPHIFADTPGQHAYQSVWLTVHPRPDCAICGQAKYRTNPMSVLPGGPSLSALRTRLG